MSQILIGILIVLHGLAHLWYFTLSWGLVEIKPEMGWSGKSWLLSDLLGNTTTRSLASVGYILATFAFIASGIGIFIESDWWRTVLVASAVFSSAVIILFWDGKPRLLVEKGFLGLLINALILTALLVLGWPPPGF
jgi:hypothetical protein